MTREKLTKTEEKILEKSFHDFIANARLGELKALAKLHSTFQLVDELLLKNPPVKEARAFFVEVSSSSVDDNESAYASVKKKLIQKAEALTGEVPVELSDEKPIELSSEPVPVELSDEKPVELFGEPVAGEVPVKLPAPKIQRVLSIEKKIEDETPLRVKGDMLFLAKSFNYRYRTRNSKWYEWSPVENCWVLGNEKEARQQFCKIWEESAAERTHEWLFSPDDKNQKAVVDNYLYQIKLSFSISEAPPGLNFRSEYLALPNEPGTWFSDSVGVLCPSKDVFAESTIQSNYSPGALPTKACWTRLKQWSRSNLEILLLFRLFFSLALAPRSGTQTGLFISGVSGSGKGLFLRLVASFLGSRCANLTTVKLTTKTLDQFADCSVIVWPDVSSISSEEFSCLSSLLGRDTRFRGTILIASQMSSDEFFLKGGSSIRDRFFTIDFLEKPEFVPQFEKEFLTDSVDGLVNWALSAPNEFYDRIVRAGAYNRSTVEASSLGRFILENVRALAPSKLAPNELDGEVTPTELFKRYKAYWEKLGLEDSDRLKRSEFTSAIKNFINTHTQHVTEIKAKNKKLYFKNLGFINKKTEEAEINGELRIVIGSLELSPFAIDESCYLFSNQKGLKELYDKA